MKVGVFVESCILRNEKMDYIFGPIFLFPFSRSVFTLPNKKTAALKCFLILFQFFSPEIRSNGFFEPKIPSSCIFFNPKYSFYLNYLLLSKFSYRGSSMWVYLVKLYDVLPKIKWNTAGYYSMMPEIKLLLC